MNLTNLLLLAITVAASLLAYAVIPWLKSRVDAQQMGELMEWVEIAVAAAEQVYASGKGKTKKQEVLTFLRAKFPDLDVAALNNAIEAAVLKLHRELE